MDQGHAHGRVENVKQLRLLASVAGADGVRHQFTTLFDYGVFDKFPRLKILVLESGAGWIGYWLDRIDAVYSHTVIGSRVPLAHKPSDYFRERIWISCDPDERTIPALAARYGVERFLWASDFPHADHTPEYVHDLNELVEAFPEDRTGASSSATTPGRCSSSERSGHSSPATVSTAAAWVSACASLNVGPSSTMKATTSGKLCLAHVAATPVYVPPVMRSSGTPVSAA